MGRINILIDFLRLPYLFIMVIYGMIAMLIAGDEEDDL